MKLFFFFYFFGFGVFAYFLVPQKSKAQSITNGSLIYNDFCYRCHGVNGVGRDNLIPPLKSSDYLLKNIDQFPQKKFFHDFKYDQRVPTDTIKYWIKAQEKINQDKKLKFFKTHNTFGALNNFNFTKNSSTRFFSIVEGI